MTITEVQGRYSQHDTSAPVDDQHTFPNLTDLVQSTVNPFAAVPVTFVTLNTHDIGPFFGRYLFAEIAAATTPLLLDVMPFWL